MTEMGAEDTQKERAADNENGKPSYLSTKPYKDVPINDQTESLDVKVKGSK
jgi:hypothetical protein